MLYGVQFIIWIVKSAVAGGSTLNKNTSDLLFHNEI